MNAKVMDKIVSLAKRRGFIYPSSEVYGGLESCWDYGPLGVRLKNNIKSVWLHAMTQEHANIEPLDSSILMHPRIWEASGHVAEFTDPLVDCKQCKARFRVDELKKPPTDPETACPICGTRGQLTEPRDFNLMFRTFMGPVEDETGAVYLRPETAQGIYVNFHNVQQTSRQKVPFGIAQIGKAFRNEITTKNFIFRTREFEQMEMQFFVKPGTDDEWFEEWRDLRMQWYRSIGIREDNLRFHPHGPGELAHYAKAAVDIEYQFPFGWKELEGIHNRTDFDLGRHQEYSGKNLEYFDDNTREKYIPYVVETSAGCDRTLLVTLCDAYREEEVKGESRTLLRIDPRLAPIKAAVFPLVKRDGMPEVARGITDELRRAFPVFYDESGAVGRRYRRQDETGTPFCVTVDSQTLEDQSVTVRNRDDMEQTRVAVDQVKTYISERIEL
jgi:glycyl-tRNA synthetase